jgi:AcrR family transcriptional regulator
MSARGRGRPPTDDPTALSNDAVLDAALDAFAERGFDGTSIRELSRDLEVSHNLIPQRFGSKDQLWRAAVDHGFGRLLATLVELGGVAESPDAPVAVDRLRAMVVAFVEANAERPALLRIINQEAAAPGPRLDHLFDSYIEPVRAFGTTVLDELRGAGKVRSDSVSLLYFLMVHGIGGLFSLNGLADRFGEDPSDLSPEARRARVVAAVDVLFDGLVER